MSQLRQLHLNLNELIAAPVPDLPARTDRERRSAIGQFLTPGPIADFMASLFDARLKNVELLDAGAGAGALTSAFIRRACQARGDTEQIQVTAYESDTGNH